MQFSNHPISRTFSSRILYLLLFSISIMYLQEPHLVYAQGELTKTSDSPSTPSVNILPTAWFFDGPLSYELAEYVQNKYEHHLDEHLIQIQKVEAYLADHFTQDETLLNCLSDGTQCSLIEIFLKQGQLKGSVHAVAKVEGAVYSVSMFWDQLQKGQVKRVIYQGKGPTLEEAADQAFDQALDMGTLVLKNVSDQAEVWIDEQKMAQKERRYLLSAGKHTLKITQKDFQAYQSEVEIQDQKTLSVDVKLVEAYSRFQVLILDPTLNSLMIKIDGKEVQASTEIKLLPGSHHIEISAEDRQTYIEDLELKAGQDETLKLKHLQYDRPYWKIALKSPHPDTLKNKNQVTVRLRLGSLRGGTWPVDSPFLEEVQDSSMVKNPVRQAYGLTQGGFDFGFKWNLDPFEHQGQLGFEPINISYDWIQSGVLNAGGDEQKGYDLTDVSRVTTRLLWLGYRFPMWRVVPHFNLGMLWISESGKIRIPEEGQPDRFQTQSVSLSGFRLGWELGVDFYWSADWLVQLALSADAWPNQRSQIQATLGFAYTFTLLDLF